MKLSHSLFFAAALAVAGVCPGADPNPGVPATAKPQSDPDLPQAFDPAAAQPMLENSPFTRALNLSDSLVLTGIAYIQGKPVATVLNKLTKESYVVSDEPNAVGWKLAQTNATLTLNRAQAKILIGNELVTVRYSNEQITPETLKKGGFKPGGGDAEANKSQDGDRPKRSFGGRGTPEERARFESLSSGAKGKFIATMIDSRARLENASDEERNAFRQKIFEQIEKEDGKGGSK